MLLHTFQLPSSEPSFILSVSGMSSNACQPHFSIKNTSDCHLPNSSLFWMLRSEQCYLPLQQSSSLQVVQGPCIPWNLPLGLLWLPPVLHRFAVRILPLSKCGVIPSPPERLSWPELIQCKQTQYVYPCPCMELNTLLPGCPHSSSQIRAPGWEGLPL